MRLGTQAQLRSNCDSGYYDTQDRNSISTFLLCTGGGMPRLERKSNASASGKPTTCATISPSMPLSTMLCSYAL